MWGLGFKWGWLGGRWWYHELETENRGNTGFQGGTRESTCQCSKLERRSSIPGTIPWGWEWQPSPAFLPGKLHGQKSLVGCRPWGCKESDMTEQLSTYVHNGGEREWAQGMAGRNLHCMGWGDCAHLWCRSEPNCRMVSGSPRTIWVSETVGAVGMSGSPARTPGVRLHLI